jgi:16S rRNA processing protein RimM
MAAERVCVAKIGAAHGVRGEVRIFTYTQDPLAICSYGELEDQSGMRRFRVASARVGKGHIVARFEGIDDRNAAEKLTHLELYIPRSRLPEQKDSVTYYHADLIGLAAETKDGERLGEVSGIQNFGAGDLLEIRLTQDVRTVMIPFNEKFVPDVDIPGGRIVIDLPDGLLDMDVSLENDRE